MRRPQSPLSAPQEPRIVARCAAARILDLASSWAAPQMPREAVDRLGACLSSQLKDEVMWTDFLPLSRSRGPIWQALAPGLRADPAPQRRPGGGLQPDTALPGAYPPCFLQCGHPGPRRRGAGVAGQGLPAGRPVRGVRAIEKLVDMLLIMMVVQVPGGPQGLPWASKISRLVDAHCAGMPTGAQPS